MAELQFQRDNWGEIARFGMFIVASEAVPEAEWWAMAPEGVSVHAARISARTPWAKWNADRSAVIPSDDLARGAAHFAAMRLDAVVTGHSSSSVLGGSGWDAALCRWLGGELRAGTHTTTNGLDCLAALAASGVERPFLVLPPWFGDATLDAATAYLKAAGRKPAAHLRHDPGPTWRAVPYGEMYPRGLGFAQDAGALYEQIVAACPVEADGVLIAGTGLRCVAIVTALEAKLGRPVITANQASLWRCLRLAGRRPEVRGYGALFEL
jgi:maleate isomerase